MEHRELYKGCSSKREAVAGFAVALEDHIIQSHQLQDLRRAEPLKSRTRNTKNIHKPLNKEVVRAAGLGKMTPHHKTKEAAEKKDILDPGPPQLTLAQKLEPPSLPLTAEEWVKIKQTHTAWRLHTSLCNTQACLKALENFTGKTSCPVCRKEQHQTRVIHDGACFFKIKCTIRFKNSAIDC